MNKKNKMNAIIAIIVASAFLMPASAVFANDVETLADVKPEMIILPATQMKNVGDTFTVDVYIDPKDYLISGANVNLLSFDQTIIQATEPIAVTFKNFFGSAVVVKELGTVDNIAGEITGIYESTTPFVGDVDTAGTWITIDFTATGIGTSPITMDIVGLRDENETKIDPITVIIGEVIVTGDVFYTLDISVDGLGTTDPAEGSYSHPSGTVVPLEAIPDLGWSFDHWVGDVADPNSATTTIIMNDDEAVTAYFTEDEYTLDITIVEGGTVTKDPDQSTYTYGTVVTLTPEPTDGWTFDSWSGPDAGDLVGPLSSWTITMDGDKDLTATFTEDWYTLDITLDGSGTVDVNPAGPYRYDDVVALTPEPVIGWSFAGWSGPDVGEIVGNSITMTKDMEITATFTEDQYYNLNIITVGNGLVILDPAEGVYIEGTSVELTAVPSFDSNFIEWSDDLSGSTNPETIVMDGDKNVTATFAYKIPGVDIFEGGSKSLIGAIDSNDVIITPIEDLYHGQTIDIEVNEDDFDWGYTTYRLYYSEYVCIELDDDYELIWNLWKYDNGVAPKIGGIYDFVFDDIHFNNSGLWIIDNDPTHDTSNRLQMNLTVPAWFWVNGTSDVLKTTLSDNNVDYNEEKEITISVTKDGEPYECLIDVRNSDNESIYDDIIIASETTFTTDSENFSCVGEYGIWTYDDLDETDILYQEFPHHYDDTYGAGVITDVAINYNYTNCGPWDPPEYMTKKILEIEESEPNIIIDPNILYWGFRNTLYINITDHKGNGLDDISCLGIEDDKEDDATHKFNDNITSGEKAGDFEIAFPHGADEWAKLGGTGEWRIFYEEDINGDGILEWSHKESFTVRGESQGVTIYVMDDGDGNRDMEVDIPVFDGMNIQPINISFRIYGESVDDVFGEEYKDDITISGDILEKATLEYDDDDEDKNIWYAMVVPKNPGKIIVSVDWEDMGSDSVSIDVINGTYVSADITAFPVGEDVTISVTVKDKDNDYVKYSHVSLFWECDEDDDELTLIETITGDGTEEKGKNGIYVFIIDKDDQGNYAPRDIYVTADTPEPNHWGYTKITMERNHELIVNCSPLESYAGDKTLYDIEVTTADGAEPDNIVVELYREDDDPDEDDYVEGGGPWIGNSFEDEEIILDSGRYYFYAHNDTHDNKENSTILVIHPYTVNCSPTVLVWNIDTEIDITFSVTPAGDGSLTIVNITGDYNVAYDEGDIQAINIENGVGTLEGITASNLGNVTFKYKPDGGKEYSAEGMLKVTTATATPNPSTVYVNEPITVTITVTHPATGEPIPDVEVGLQSNILVSQPDNETTDANGQVHFGITTGGSGDITILIECKFDTDNEFIIKSKLRKTMIIDTPLTVEEGDGFTVNIKTLMGDFVTDLVTVEFAGSTFTTSTGTLQLIAPMVSTDTDYRIRASATGYYNDEDTIRVTAKPEIKKLSMVISDFTGEGKTKFKVIVIDDTGRSIAGATITFDGKEHQTTATGVDLTTPNKKGTYGVTASFTGFESCSESLIVTKEVKDTPGFELLTLVAALGVCFILLRRRKKY